MSAALFFLPYQAATINGIAAPGAELYFYITATTTPLTVYTNSALTIPASNPVIADGAGRFAEVYLDGTKTHRLIIKDKNGATLADIDPYIPGTSDSALLQPYQDAAAASAVAASGSATATAADRVQTGLDATATAADRVQTGLDRVQTGLDRTQTGLDRTQTGIDATATAADRTAVHTDRLAADTSATTAAANAAAATGTAALATRSALALVSGSAGMARQLTEAGREGVFVWSSANNSANVTADPQQGIYVAPASDTTGASGAWVRKYTGPVFIEWFGGGVSAADTVNTTAWLAATALCAPCEIKLKAGTYSATQIVFPGTGTGAKGVVLKGAGRAATVLLITGDGGGAISSATNGAVQMFERECSLEDLNITYSNPSLLGLLNVGNNSGGGRVTIKNVDLAPAGTLTTSQVQCVAVSIGALTAFEWIGGQIGASPNFLQNVKLLSGSLMNGCKFEQVTFRPHVVDLPNGVYGDANYLVDLNGRSTQCLEFDACIFENGPNGVACSGQGEVSFPSCYFGDGYNSKNPVGWLPSQVVAQGDFIYPSTAVAATSDGSTAVLTGVSPTTALYAGMKVNCVGMGAAGANLPARILSISGSTVTLDTNTATAVTGSFYYGTYAGHGYRCTVAGTTGSSPPTWPTTAGTTVADNTVTWKEYGPCAWIDLVPPGAAASKNTVTMKGCLVSTGLVGVVGIRAGGILPQAISIQGCQFTTNDHAAFFDGAAAVHFAGNSLITYSNHGVMVKAVAGSSPCNAFIANYPSSTLRGADFIAGNNSTSLGGIHIGNTTLTGLGAARFVNHVTSASPSLALPGTLSVVGASTVTSVAGTSTITTTGGGIGYAAGAGSTGVQSTSKATGITMHKLSGQITMNAAALASATIVSFVLTNNTIAANDVLIINHISGGTPGSYSFNAQSAAGSATINVRNNTAGSLSEAIVLQFAVVKAVAA